MADPQSKPNRFVLAAIADLFFLVQVKDAANRVGLDVKNAQNLDALATLTAKGPAMVVVDLHCAKLDPVNTIRKLKTDLGGVPIVAFLSHVEVALGQSAKEAGADIVVPRSAFLKALKEALGSLPPPADTLPA